jgi:hypothetical protein
MADTAEKETAYAHYNRLHYRVDKEELDKVFGPGEPKLESYGFSGVVQVEYWAPLIRLEDGESTGFTVRTGGRKLSEISHEVYSAMKDMVDESLGLFCYDDGIDPYGDWPDDVRWIAVFPVTGSSEGHYVHVELIRDQGKRSLFMLGKTFQGMEHAKAMCSKIIDLLGC